jgi:cytochrome o ubiquinol oxidase operon protein cyoD
VIAARHETAHGTVRSYTVGFVLSLVLTLAAYLLVSHGVYDGWALVGALAVLAVTQLFVQLGFFLHLGRESRPRWNLTVMLFAVMVVFIVVFGSLWIMKNLQYNHHHHGLTPAQTNDLIIHDEGYQQ